MKTKDISSLLHDADDETVSRLSEGRVMTDDERKRVYIMSKKKLNEMNRGFVNAGDEVSGVERDTRPVWRRYAGFAAALVVGIGVLGGSGIYLMRNAGSGASQSTSVYEQVTEAEYTEAVTASQALEETVTANGVTEEQQFQVNRLTKAYVEFGKAIFGTGLEVDRSAPVKKNITSEGGVVDTLVFYPVTDERYRTWDDVVSRAHAIFSDELAERVIDGWDCVEESEIDNNKMCFFYRNETGWYIESIFIDDKVVELTPYWIEDEPVVTVNADGTLSTTLTQEVQGSEDIMSVTFTIGQVDNGMSDNWRILSFEESYVDNTNTDERAAANELTDMYLDLAATLSGVGLDVDKNTTVTREYTDSFGDTHPMTFYLVTDETYNSWSDVEAMGQQIFTDDLVKANVESCHSNDESDTVLNSTMYLSIGNSWYIRSDICDVNKDTSRWLDECELAGQPDENTLIATRTCICDNTGDISHTDFTFVKSEADGTWRIKSEESYPWNPQN